MSGNGQNLSFKYNDKGVRTEKPVNGVEYWYIRNAQNDIIGLVDNTGTQVAGYTYDSWVWW